MSGSLIGHSIALRLLGNNLSGANLQTELGTAANLGAFIKLINCRSAVKDLVLNSNAMTAIAASALAIAQFAESDIATEELVKNSAAARKLVTTTGFLTAYTSDANKLIRLKVASEQTNSKFKRQVFLSSGTFSIPENGLNIMSILCLGGGSSGVSNEDSGGGAGGETEVLVISSGCPESDLTVTVGAGGTAGGASTAGGTTSAGSLISAAGGLAAVGNAGCVGGGVNSGGGSASLTTVNLIKTMWQFTTCSVKGGNGGNFGVAGSAGVYGSGGAVSLPGTGFASGGGGGSTGSGLDAINNTGCGSGGGTNSLGVSGHGGSGLCIICYVIN